MHGSEQRTDLPSPERRSRDSVAVRHPKASHRVENTARELHLHALALKGSTSHASADDRLVSVDSILDQAAPAVSGARVPLASTEFSDRADVTVSLPQRGRGPWTQLGIASRRNEHSDCSTFTALLSGFVHGTGVVRTVGRDRREGLIYLLKQGRNLGRVMRPTARQIRCNDLTRASVDREVQFSPSPVPGRFPQMTDMNPEPSAVDEQMDRSIRGEPAKSNVPELLQPPGQRRMVGDREVHLEHMGQRP